MAPTVKTTFEFHDSIAVGTIALLFGNLQPGDHAILSLEPLTTVLWSTFREACIVLPEQEAQRKKEFAWPPYEPSDQYDQLSGPEHLSSALEKLRDSRNEVVIAEDPHFYKPRHPGLAQESVELRVTDWHAAHCSSLTDHRWVSRGGEGNLELGLVSRGCYCYDPSDPCSFALTITVRGADGTPNSLATTYQQVQNFTEMLAGLLKIAYA